MYFSDACDHHLLPPCAVVPVVVYDHEFVLVVVEP